MSVSLAAKPAPNVDAIPCATDDPLLMPVEHLEARICELAGHITAATCRYLQLVADFDARDAAASLDWDAALKPWPPQKVPAADLAGALTEICGQYLSGRAATAGNPDPYQVIIHAGTGAPTAAAPTAAPERVASAPDAPRKRFTQLRQTPPRKRRPAGQDRRSRPWTC